MDENVRAAARRLLARARTVADLDRVEVWASDVTIVATAALTASEQLERLATAVDRYVCGYCHNRVGYTPASGEWSLSVYHLPCKTRGCAPLRAVLATTTAATAAVDEFSGPNTCAACGEDVPLHQMYSHYNWCGLPPETAPTAPGAEG